MNVTGDGSHYRTIGFILHLSLKTREHEEAEEEGDEEEEGE